MSKKFSRGVAMVAFVGITLILAGCPNGGLVGRGLTDLTVGGNPVAGYLQPGMTNWYRFQIPEDKAGEPFDVIIRNIDAYPVAVGSVVRLFSSTNRKGRLREQELQLEWEHVLQPVETYVQLTQEQLNVNLTKADFDDKAVRLAGFVAPQAGYYFVSISGYELMAGKKPANSYQYRDTIAYSIAVRFTPRAGTQDGVDVNAEEQKANVALITGILPAGEITYHPITLTKDTPYQVQVITNGAINWCVFEASTCMRVDPVTTVTCDPDNLCDDCDVVQNRFFTVPRGGQYYLKFEHISNEDFGYAQYRVRVYQRDYVDKELGLQDGSYPAYLTKCDTDSFKFVFPANTGQNPIIYTVTIEIPEALTISSNPNLFVYDNDNGQYTLTITQDPDNPDTPQQEATERDVAFDVQPKEPEIQGLEGYGAYSLNVTVQKEEQQPQQ